MWTRLPTRCCSALALTAFTIALSVPAAAQSSAASPPSIFPTQPLWTLPLNNQLTVPPGYDDTRGYFAIDGGRLAAYDLVTGTQRWLIAAHPQFEPAAGEGLVFLAEPGALRALHAADGSTAWQYPLPEGAAVPPVWDNQWLVVATDSNEVLAFRAADGHLIWRHRVPATAHARPALAADRVYVPLADGRVVAIRIENGDRLWDRQLGGPATDILALDERLYLGSLDNFFYCLLAADGRIDWRWRTGADIIGRPAISGPLIYFLSLDNVLRALHHSSGVQRWRASVPLRPTSGPIVAGGAIVVSGVGAKLPAFNAVDGKPLGELSAAGENAAPPHVVTPASGFPIVITIGRDIVTGATVTAVTRSKEPTLLPMAPLPNLMPMTAPPRPSPAVPGTR